MIKQVFALLTGYDLDVYHSGAELICRANSFEQLENKLRKAQEQKLLNDATFRFGIGATLEEAEAAKEWKKALLR